MITDIVLGVPLAIINAVLALLPVWNPLTDSTNFAHELARYALFMEGYFPVRFLGGCLLTVLGARLALLSWHAISMLYDKIPGKFT